MPPCATCVMKGPGCRAAVFPVQRYVKLGNVMKLMGKNMEKDDSGTPRGRHRPCIWILVADRHVARLYRKNNGHLKEFTEIVPDIPRPDRRLANATLGRAALPAGIFARHKYEPHMNAARKEELGFVRDIAAWLDGAARGNAFDRLVLVAAPATLGELRQALGSAVQDRIVAEVNKDLTKMGDPELQAELEKIVWF